MKVKDVMTTPAVTVGPSTGYLEVIETMLDHDISGLPVVDDDGRVLGVVSEADLLSKEAYGVDRRRPLGLLVDYLRARDPQWVRKGAARSARELMTAVPEIARPDEDLAVAARRMLEWGYKRLPVVDQGGHILGIIARHDLLSVYDRDDRDILADVDEILDDPSVVVDTRHIGATVTDGVVEMRGKVPSIGVHEVIHARVGAIPGVIGIDNGLHVFAGQQDEVTST